MLLKSKTTDWWRVKYTFPLKGYANLRQAAEDISNRIANVAKTTSPMPPHDKPRANLRMVKYLFAAK